MLVNGYVFHGVLSGEPGITNETFTQVFNCQTPTTFMFTLTSETCS